MEKKIVIPVVVVLALVVAATILYYRVLLPREQEWKLEIIANGDKVATHRLSQLAKEATSIWIEHYQSNATVVPLSPLLQEDGVDPTKVLSFTPYGSDGYHREIEGASLDYTYIQIVDINYVAKNGPLRLICEGISEKFWVKYLVSIELQVEG